VRGKFALEDMPQDVSVLMGLVTLTFDHKAGMPVASKAGNLQSELGYDRPLGSRVIRLRDRRTDGQKQSILPLPYERGHNNYCYNRTIYKAS